MALEAGTYVNDLVVTNPVGATDFVSNGDDHLRLIKTVLKNTFPNATRAFYLPSTTALQTGTVNVVAADQGKIIPVSAEDAARTVNLPANSTLTDGWSVTIVKADHSANLVIIDGNSSDTINGALTFSLHQRYQSVKIIWCSAISGFIAQGNEPFPIGFVSAGFSSVLPDGWLWLNGTAIGSAASAASGRANADCLGLYQLLWNALSNSEAAVSGGRGASAAADFAANKTLTLPNLGGRVIAGRETMNGVTDVDLLTTSYFGADANTLGVTGGSQSHTITEAQLPSHEHTGTTSSNGEHTHTVTLEVGAADSIETGSGRLEYTSATTITTSSNGAHTHTFTTSTVGSDTAHNNVQPTIIANYMIKL